MIAASASDESKAVGWLWAVVLGSFLFVFGVYVLDGFAGGDGYYAPLVLTMIGSCVGVVAAPFLVRYAIKHPRSKPLVSLSVLAAGALYVLWLDAEVILLGRDLGAEGPHYVLPTAFFSILLVLVFPYRARGWYLLPVGVLALWGWRTLVPTVEWNNDKRMALAIRQVRGGSVAELQRVMADYSASVHKKGERVAYSKIGAMQLETLQPCGLSISGGLGGVWIDIDDGQVVRIAPNFD